MVDQDKHVETLQTEVNQVAADLVEAKKQTDEAIKKTKAEAAALKAETTLDKVKTAKEDANKKLKALEGKTDALSKAEVIKLQTEIDTYESMLTTLDLSKTELATLKAGVVTIATDQKQDEKIDNTPKEKKNWFKKQRDGFSDSSEENHTLKNAARIAGGIGVAVLAYQGLRSLFGRGKNKKEGFWNHGVGKILKYTGIGTAAYYVIHGISTGRWGLADFLNWDKKKIEDNPKSLQEWFDKIPESERLKYNEFASMVDKYNINLNSSTTLGSMIDNNGKPITIPGGAVPAIMDTIYENVGDIISTDSYISDKWTEVSHKLGDFVTSIGESAVTYIFSPMVGIIKGLTADMFGSDGKPNEKFTTWANAKDEDRDVQIGRMMEKYGDVRSFLQAKRQQLEEKYAAQQIGGNPTEEQIKDYLDDADNKKIVDERVKVAFLDKKIVGANDAESAMVAMKKDDVFDETTDPLIKEQAERVQSRKKEVLPDETIFTQAIASPDVNKDPTLKKNLQEVSINFSKKLDDGFLEGNFIESFCAWSGLRIDEIWNSKSNDRLIILEELGFSPRMQEIRNKNAVFMNKLAAGEVTKSDIEECKRSIDEYFEMEQNIMVRGEQRNRDDAKKGFWDKTFSRGYGRFTSVATWVMTPQGIGISVAILGVNYVTKGFLFKAAGQIIGWPIKKIGSVAWKTLGFTAETALRRVNVLSGSRLGNYIKYKLYGKGDFGKFISDMKKGGLDMSQIEYVYANRASDWNTQGKSLNQLISDTFNIKEGEDVQIFRDYFEGNIRKMSKNPNFKAADLVSKLKSYDTKVNTLIDERKVFCSELFHNANLSSIDDITKITNNIDAIDITGLSTKQIKILAKELGKDVSVLSDAVKVSAKIEEVKKMVSGGVDILKSLTSKQKAVYSVIGDDAKEIKTTIKNLNINPATYTGKYYMKQVDGLEQFQKKMASFTDDEIDAFNALRKLEFKSYHIIEIFELKKIAAIGGELNKLKNGAADLSGLLRQLKYSQTAGADISESLIKTIDTIHVKNLLKSSDEVGAFIKNIFKFLSKIT